MKPIEVRRATVEDVDAIVPLWREMMELHQQVEPAVWTMVPDADEVFRSYLGKCLADADHMIAVAVSGSDLLGFIHAAKGQRPPVLEPSSEGIIHGCCVTSSARRRGIGRRLVAHAMQWFRQQELPLARAGWATANPCSGPFWVAQGFRPYMTTGVRAVASSCERAESGKPGRDTECG